MCRNASARLLAAALLTLSGFAPCIPSPSHAQTGPATHAEFDLTHTETVGGVTDSLVDSNPGQDAGASILVTGGVVGTYGDHNISVEAQVVAQANNNVRLMAEGEHLFALSGINDATDVWRSVDSSMLARAELIDDLTVTSASGVPEKVELYFQIRGMSEVLIDQAPASDLFYTADTLYRFEATTEAPHSGGGIHNGSIGWSGYLFGDLDAQKFVDDYVVMSFDLDPAQSSVRVQIRFEIEPTTSLSGGVEFDNLMTDGLHRPSFWDMGAELLGVVVRDAAEAPLADAMIVSDSGYDYPVEEMPPPPQLPAKVILSPVAVVDSDLGELAPLLTPFENMIDQSGLNVPFTSGQTSFDVYFSDTNAQRADNGPSNNWQSAVVTTLPLQGFVDFDLGAQHTIDRLAIWNLSLEDIRVLIADSAAGPWTEIGQYTLPSNLNVFSTYSVEVLDLGGQHMARYLRIEADSAHLTDPTFAYATVGEVAVSSVTPVPEPGMLLMACWGVGGLALLSRRRTRRSRFLHRG